MSRQFAARVQLAKNHQTALFSPHPTQYFSVANSAHLRASIQNANQLH